MGILGKIFLFILLTISNAFALQPTKSHHAMVVTEQALATQVGLDILHAGGNAIDAAVAIGYALAVVNPCCGNIGGGGFITLHLSNGQNIFLNFRETAPAAITQQHFLDQQSKVIPEKSTYGYLAVAVPGTVLGLETALKQYGSMERQKLISPAIQLAKKGYILRQGDIDLLAKYTDYFQKQKNVAAIFLKNGKALKTGDRLIQQDLAQTLQLISDKGSNVFYKGSIADKIVQASQQNHGVLAKQDFYDYKVNESNPIECDYHGYHIITAPPPSSGGITLCEILNILEPYPLKSLGYHSAQSVHYIVEAMKLAFADRNTLLGDPHFVNNPVAQLISKKYAAQLRESIKKDKAIPVNKIKFFSPEGSDTTHYSVIDEKGNAVSVTYTLNSLFGAKVIAENTGFFLNNEMDDFTIKLNEKNQFGLIQGTKNLVQPRKQPLSSMTPTIITKNNKVVMIVGSPGGPRIITSTLLTILNVLDYGMNIQDAVNAGRFHHQWMPDEMYVEPATLSAKTVQQLKVMGHQIQPGSTWGAVEAIYIDPVTHIIYGANDQRRSAGKAMGY